MINVQKETNKRCVDEAARQIEAKKEHIRRQQASVEKWSDERQQFIKRELERGNKYSWEKEEYIKIEKLRCKNWNGQWQHWYEKEQKELAEHNAKWTKWEAEQRKQHAEEYRKYSQMTLELQNESREMEIRSAKSKCYAEVAIHSEQLKCDLWEKEERMRIDMEVNDRELKNQESLNMLHKHMALIKAQNQDVKIHIRYDLLKERFANMEKEDLRELNNAYSNYRSQLDAMEDTISQHEASVRALISDEKYTESDNKQLAFEHKHFKWLEKTTKQFRLAEILLEKARKTVFILKITKKTNEQLTD